MDELNWCIARLQEALDDYNIEAARDYLAMLELWKERLNHGTST